MKQKIIIATFSVECTNKDAFKDDFQMFVSDNGLVMKDISLHHKLPITIVLNLSLMRRFV